MARAPLATVLAAASVFAHVSGTAASAPDPGLFWTSAANATLVGRWVINETDGSVFGDWAGIRARVTVAGNFSYLSALIDDGCAGNKLAVQMWGNGGVGLRTSTLYTSPRVQRYVLFSNVGRVSMGNTSSVTFDLVKAVEARFTQCTGAAPLRLLGFEADAPFLPPPPPSRRRLLVLGDSITSGDLLECCPTASGCTGRMSLPNSLWADDVTLTYGSLTCAGLGADCHTISWGGIGAAAGDTKAWTWPSLGDVYPCTLGWDCYTAGPGVPPALPYNQSSFVPAGVITNLGTNDAAGERFNNATFAALYVQRYSALLLDIAAAAAPVKPVFFLGVGPMTAAYGPSASKVVDAITAAGYSAQMLNLTLPSGCGCGHPSAADHALLAQLVQPAVASALGW